MIWSTAAHFLGFGFTGGRGIRLAKCAAATPISASPAGMKLCASTVKDAMPEQVPETGKTSQFMIVVNNEDYRAETAVLNKMSECSSSPNFYSEGGGLNVMTVIGGADTTLVSLMHPGVGSVTGIDMSPNALHLLRLKLAVAVCEDLSTPQAMGFLAQGQNGRKVLRENLLKHLPDDSASFFLQEELDKDIYHGILRKDNDNSFNICLRKMLETDHGLYLSQFDTMTLAEKEELFRVLEAPESAEIMYKLLENDFQSSPWFQALPDPMQAHLLTVINLAGKYNLNGAMHVLRDSDRGLIPLDDYYTNVLRYGQPFLPGASMALPPWLTDAGRATLRAKQGSLHTVCGKMEDLDEFDGAPFDLMTLSNCYDFVPEEVATESIKILAGKALKDGGNILIRRASGKADEILADAGGRADVVDNLHIHDRAILIYRHPGAIACASFSADMRADC